MPTKILLCVSSTSLSKVSLSILDSLANFINASTDSLELKNIWESHFDTPAVQPTKNDDGETITFADGTGAEFVTSATNTVTVNSVDSEIDHDSLSNFATNYNLQITKIEKKLDTVHFTISYDGKMQNDFRPKIEKYFASIIQCCPYLLHFNLEINTKNTFPHSSGIASSASGMSALSLCLSLIHI